MQEIIIFYQRPIVINEINSDCSKNCKNYYLQYNTHSAETIFIFKRMQFCCSYIS